MPIESLIKSSVIPDFCKSLLSCACVVLAGCITNDLASPILARCENSFRLFINLIAFFLPPLFQKII